MLRLAGMTICADKNKEPTPDREWKPVLGKESEEINCSLDAGFRQHDGSFGSRPEKRTDYARLESYLLAIFSCNMRMKVIHATHPAIRR